jgi:HAD superfamily hydrolase (TIGR01509 family)
MTRRPRAIIFDCDGVLIDSERVACEIDARELSAHGVSVTPAELSRRFSGVAYRDMYRILEVESGVRLPDGYGARVHELVLRACIEEGRGLAMPGIHALLEALGERPRGVASSSGHEWLSSILQVVDLWRHFAPHVYSAAEVAKGKPAPDLFLHAAARLDIAPRDCLVIEDSVAGIQAARAAGMTVYGFCGGGHCDATSAARFRAEGAALVFHTMVALEAALCHGAD